MFHHENQDQSFGSQGNQYNNREYYGGRNNQGFNGQTFTNINYRQNDDRREYGRRDDYHNEENYRREEYRGGFSGQNRGYRDERNQHRPNGYDSRRQYNQQSYIRRDDRHEYNRPDQYSNYPNQHSDHRFPGEDSYRADNGHQERRYDQRQDNREPYHGRNQFQGHQYQQYRDYPPRQNAPCQYNDIRNQQYRDSPSRGNAPQNYRNNGYNRPRNNQYQGGNNQGYNQERNFRRPEHGRHQGYNDQNQERNHRVPRQFDQRQSQRQDYNRGPRQDYGYRTPSENNGHGQNYGFYGQQTFNDQYRNDYNNEQTSDQRNYQGQSLKELPPSDNPSQTPHQGHFGGQLGGQFVEPNNATKYRNDRHDYEEETAFVQSPQVSSVPFTEEPSTSKMSARPSKKSISEWSETLNQTPISSIVPSIEDLNEAVSQLVVSSEQMEQGSSRDCGIPKLLVEAPIAPAHRHDKEKVLLTTNFFPMEVTSKIVYRYDVTMTVVAADGRAITISKTPKDDAGRTQRHETCVAAIRAALEMYGILRQGEHAIYDQAAMLFSSECMDANLKPNSNTLHVSIDILPEKIRRSLGIGGAKDIAIEIQPSASGESQFDISKFRDAHKNRDLSSLDRSWQQFYDMLTSEPAVHGGKYTAFGSGKLFPKNVRGQAVKNKGQETFNGVSKGVAFIEPKNDKMVPALVLDAKVGQFFKAQNVILTVCDFMGNWDYDDIVSAFPFPNQSKLEKEDWGKINGYIRGLRFTMVIGNSESSFVASGISDRPIDQLTERNMFGKDVPVLQCSRFGLLDLSNVRRHWPAVVVRGKFDKKVVTSYYPMEFLTVAKNQRVPICKMDDGKPKPQHVNQRFQAIHNMIAELNLDSSSPQSKILKSFGVRIAPKPLSVTAIRRSRPAIMGASGKSVQLDNDRGTFKFDKFVEPGAADDVVIAHDCHFDVVRKMKDRLDLVTCSQGIRVGKWHFLSVEQRAGKIKNVFETVKKWKSERKVGRTVLIIYVDHVDSKSHGLLKLYERMYLIQTQHLTIKVASEIPSKNMTCQNVLNKMNCKLGGLNYRVNPDNYAAQDWIRNGKTLVIGYDVAHPSGVSREDQLDKKPPVDPSVVGFSFNGAKNPEAFIGDFHYQLPKKEQVSDTILNSRIKWMLEMFHKNRGQLPESIVIIRDGVSEGQYDMVLNKEFQAIKEGVEEFQNMNEREIKGIQNWQPKFSLIVVCKRHNKRFAVDKGRAYENPKTGTVIDDTVTRTDMTQFYMQPHHANQGTSKLPAFQVLVNNALTAGTQDKLQSFIFALCFNHQIFGGAVSLPEPVYQADEWAKRGNDIYKVYAETYEIPRLKAWNKNIYSTAPIDYEKVTEQLCYQKTSMVGSRVNA